MNRLMMFHLFFQSQQRLMLFKLLECALKKLLVFATILKKLCVLTHANMKSDDHLLLVTITNRMIMNMMTTTTMKIITIHVLLLVLTTIAHAQDLRLRLQHRISISTDTKKSTTITKRGPVVSLMESTNQDLFLSSILCLKNVLTATMEGLVVSPMTR